MALKILVNQKNIERKRSRIQEIDAALGELNTRESQCESALNELSEESTQEERQVVEDEASAIDEERSRLEDEKNSLQQEIDELERNTQELIDAEKRVKKSNSKTPEKRKDLKIMETREFFKMNHEQRNAFFADEKVKSFLERTRELMKTRASVSGGELLIPDNVFSLIKQTLPRYSKLYDKVTVRQVNGTARQPIMGEVPEAIWTEMCAKLNELEIGFNMTEFDGYKLGGFFAVCNATLEDSDIALATELINALSQAIAKALDKAILFGGGKEKKMPLGIVTRLLLKEAGTDQSSTDRDFEDLSTSNVITIPTSKTDIALFKAITDASGAISSDYASDSIVWSMNRKTKTALMSNSMGVNSAAAVVSGIGNQMPAIGGDIVELGGGIIPDNIIVAGYFENYTLAERAGVTISQSEHYRFVEDQTVFKGTARYDGKPIIPEAFVVIGINGTTPSLTGITFNGQATEEESK